MYNNIKKQIIENNANRNIDRIAHIDIEGPLLTNLEPITEKELQTQITSLKTKSCAGPDEIGVAFIKENSKYLTKPIKYIINLIFQQGIVPNAFKASTVTPIYKSNSKKEMTNYRPISVISNIAKIFEKFLKHKIININY